MSTLPFNPPWWLSGGHAQTLFPALLRRAPAPRWRRERLELSDGDFIDLDWSDPDPHTPLTILLHGLEGSSRSSYIGGLATALNRAGIAAVVLNFRGCSGEPNRLARAYHSGDSDELRHLLALLRERWEQRTLLAVGFSLGGNLLVKYLGEAGMDSPLSAAVAVSVPFQLDRAADRLAQGASRIYQRWLIGHLHASYRRKFASRSDGPVTLHELHELTTFRRFDDRITAPLHGFEGVDDYYARASSRPWLGNIATPTLLLQAQDDPFMCADLMPTTDELSASTRLESPSAGGHVGFVAPGPNGRGVSYWAEQRIVRFFRQQLGLDD